MLFPGTWPHPSAPSLHGVDEGMTYGQRVSERPRVLSLIHIVERDG
jgi:hypothetical protein